MKKLLIILLSFVAFNASGQGITIHKASTANAPAYSLGKLYFNTDSNRVMIGVGGVYRGTPFTSDVVGGSAGLADSMQILRDSISVLRALINTPVVLDTTMKNDEDGLGLDTTSQVLKDFIALYGADGVGEGGDGIQPSDTATMLAGYTRVNRFLDSLSNHWTAILNRVTATRFTDSISTLRTLANTKISNANLNVGYSGTQVTVISDNGTDAQIDGPTSSNAGVFTSALYNYFFTVGSATWGTGNVSVSALNQKHNITISSSGGRTLAFAFLDAGEVIAMHIDNTSGGTITLTLPSNSYVQNPTTGEYTSAASVTIVTGKSSLYLSKYDGTDYWFVY